MAVAFSQSLRSLQAERRLFSLLWLLIVSALLLLWLLWFFFATFTIQAQGQIVQTTSAGVVIAEFSATEQSRLQIGQPALIQTMASANQPRAAAVTVPAIITAIDPAAQPARLRVTLYTDMDSPNAGVVQPNLTGQVAVIVAHSSPASLVLRNGAGQ